MRYKLISSSCREKKISATSGLEIVITHLHILCEALVERDVQDNKRDARVCTNVDLVRVGLLVE